MWFNGFIIVIDMALAKLRNPLLSGYREALILGSFREDVCFVGGIDAVFQSPSLSHFCRARMPGGFIPWIWADAGQRTEKFAVRAVRESQSGRVASAMVQLGRAVHPLIDMCCPVHAQGVLHTTDPFEWCVEAMGDRLRALPVPGVPAGARFADPTLAMARMAQRFVADGTNSPWGKVMRRAGLRRSVNHTLAREQALLLIPAAAAYTAALFEMFLARASTAVAPVRNRESARIDTLRALEMSPAGLRRWFGQLDRFCARHGGPRHYVELLELLERCALQLRAVPG